MIVLTAGTTGAGFFVVEKVLLRREAWLTEPPKIMKRLALLCAAVAWSLVAVFLAVWVWAVVYLWIEIFPTTEEALYFSIVAYTTLGFGDILLPVEWRLLAGIEALNGLLMIGLQTAMLIDVMTRVRRIQMGTRDQ